MASTIASEEAHKKMIELGAKIYDFKMKIMKQKGVLCDNEHECLRLNASLYLMIHDSRDTSNEEKDVNTNLEIAMLKTKLSEERLRDMCIELRKFVSERACLYQKIQGDHTGDIIKPMMDGLWKFTASVGMPKDVIAPTKYEACVPEQTICGAEETSDNVFVATTDLLWETNETVPDIRPPSTTSTMTSDDFDTLSTTAQPSVFGEPTDMARKETERKYIDEYQMILYQLESLREFLLEAFSANMRAQTFANCSNPSPGDVDKAAATASALADLEQQEARLLGRKKDMEGRKCIKEYLKKQKS